MSLLDRYLFRTVLATSLVVLALLLVLDTFFSLLTELEDAGFGDYGLAEVARFLLLTLPGRIYETLPVALLVGGLLGMGALASHSELVVMRGAGRSILRLVLAALAAGLLLSAAGVLLGEYAAPALERLAKEQRIAARTRNTLLYPGRGFWARDGNNIIGIGTVIPGPVLVDIDIYRFNDRGELQATLHARRGHFEGGHWQLEDVRQRTIDPQSVTTRSQATIPWESVLTPSTLEVLAADPSDLAMRELLTYIDYLQANQLDTHRYELAFWTKALAPLANLSMLYIAMPFAFVRQRTPGVGQRLVIGILLGLLFFLLNRMLGNIVLLYGFPPIAGAALPMLLLYAAGTVALRRLR